MSTATMDLAGVERLLASLATNPQVLPEYRHRLSELHSAVVLRQLLGKNTKSLTVGDLDRLELLVARIHFAVEAKQNELELQSREIALEAREYRDREQQLVAIATAVVAKRKELQESGEKPPAPTRTPRKGGPSKSTATSR